MYRIDKFLKYYNSLDVQTEIEHGVWVKAKPLPFYYGIFTRGYWKMKWGHLKDAIEVLKGKADVVTWENKNEG